MDIGEGVILGALAALGLVYMQDGGLPGGSMLLTTLAKGAVGGVVAQVGLNAVGIDVGSFLPFDVPAIELPQLG